MGRYQGRRPSRLFDPPQDRHRQTTGDESIAAGEWSRSLPDPAPELELLRVIDTRAKLKNRKTGAVAFCHNAAGCEHRVNLEIGG